MILLGPIFVTGMPRSGTTLLASLINAHSQVAVSPETDYFNLVWKPIARTGGFRDCGTVEAILVTFFGVANVMRIEFPVDDLMTQFRSQWEQHTLDHSVILETMLSWYASKRGKPLWAEKTPDHFMYIPAIKSIFPAARVVAIVRDPRDVHLSLSKLPWSRGNALNHALQWRGYQSLARIFETSFDGSFVQVRYEDLIADPHGTTQILCNKLGLPFEAGMVERHAEELIFDPKAEPWKQEVQHPINSSNHTKWPNVLPAQEVALFSRICEKYLRAWGYEVPRSSVFPGPMLKGLEWRSVAWWLRTNWRVKHGRDPWLGETISRVRRL